MPAVEALNILGEDSVGTGGTTSVGHARKRTLNTINAPSGAEVGDDGMGGIMEGSEEGEDDDDEGVVNSGVGEGPTPQRRRRGGKLAVGPQHMSHLCALQAILENLVCCQCFHSDLLPEVVVYDPLFHCFRLRLTAMPFLQAGSSMGSESETLADTDNVTTDLARIVDRLERPTDRAMVESIASQWREARVQAQLMQRELDDMSRLAEAKDQQLRCGASQCVMGAHAHLIR